MNNREVPCLHVTAQFSVTDTGTFCSRCSCLSGRQRKNSTSQSLFTVICGWHRCFLWQVQLFEWTAEKEQHLTVPVYSYLWLTQVLSVAGAAVWVDGRERTAPHSPCLQLSVADTGAFCGRCSCLSGRQRKNSTSQSLFTVICGWHRCFLWQVQLFEWTAEKEQHLTVPVYSYLWLTQVLSVAGAAVWVDSWERTAPHSPCLQLSVADTFVRDVYTFSGMRGSLFERTAQQE